MPRSVSIRNVNNDANRQAKTIDQAIQKSVTISASVNTVNTVSPLNTEQLETSCENRRRRGKKVVNPVIESGNVCHRKSERRRIARDIFLVFEEQCNSRRRSRHSNKKSTAKAKPKFGHLNIVENPVNKHAKTKLLQDIKNEPKCYLNNNNNNNNNNINININNSNNNSNNNVINNSNTTTNSNKCIQQPETTITTIKKSIKCQNTCTNTVDVKANVKSSTSSVALPTTLPLSLSTVTPIAKVNPIFLWTKQDDTRIVEVRCEDYDKRNRIRLTKTSNGNWKAIPCTDPTSTKVVRCLYTPTPPLMKVKCEKDLEQQQRQQQHQTQLHDNQIDLLSNQNINNNSNNNNNKSNSDNSNCVFRRGIEELMVTPTIPTTPTRAIIATTPTAAAATTSDIDIKFNLVERKVVLNTANRKRSKRKGKSRKRKIIRNKSPNVNYLNRIGTPVDDNVPVKIRNNRVLETNKIFNQNLPLQACDNKCDVEAILPPSPSLPSSLLAPLASAPLPSTSTSPSPLSSPSFELVQSSLPQPNSNDQHVDSIKNVHTNSIHRSNENYDLALSIIRDSVTSTPVELVVPSIVNAYQSRLDDFNVQLCPKTGLFIPAITDNNNSDKLKNRNNINNNNTEASNCLIRRSDSNDDLVPVESTESSKISANKMNDIGNDIQNITVNNNEIETDERDIKLSTTLECAQTVVECKKSSDEMLMMTESLEAKTRNLKDLLDSADLLDHCDITNGHGNHEELIESLVKTSCEGNLMVEEKDHQQQQLQHQHQTEPEELQLLQLHQKLEREQNQQEVEQSESADRLTSSANELPKCLSFNEAGEIDFFQSNTCTELAFEKSPATSDSIIFHDTTEMVMTPIKATTPLFSLLNFDDDAPKDLSYKRRNLNDDICCPQSESSSQCAVTSSSDIMKSPATHPIGIGESLSFAAPSSDTMKNMVFEEFLKFNTQSTDQQQQQPVKTSQSNEPIDLGKRKLIGVTTKSNALANLMEQVIVDDDSDNNNNIVNGRSNNRENENCSDVINAKAVDDNVAPISQSLQTALNSSRYSDVDVKVVNANETGSSNGNGNGTVTGTGSNSGKPNTNKSHIKVPATTLMNEDPDPYTQLQLLLRNTQWKVPDPILVPKDRLGAVLASPAREIPLLITTRPELKLPEAFAYPEIIQNPNILVISMAQLEAILKNNELEKSKAINVTNNVEHDDNVLDKNVFGNEFNRKGHKSQITKIENNNKTIDKEKTAGVVTAAAAVAIAPPTVLATSKTPVMSHNSPQNKNVNVKSLQNYLDVEGSLGTEMNASTLAMLNQMLWLPYFGQLSQDIVKGSKTSAPLTLQHLQSFLPFYNAQASLKHLDDIYKNYWKHQQRQQHDVNDVNNILSMHHPHHQRQHQSKHYPNTSNLKAATVATATATGSAAVANNEIEKQCDKKQTHSKLINGFINNYNSDTSSKQYYGYPDVNLANIHSHIHHPYQDTQSYTTNLQQHQPHQSQLYKNHHRHQKTMTSNQYVMQQMIEEKSSNLLLNRLEKLNECSAPTEKSDDGNDKKPRLTCKSLANLLNPEYTHQNDLMISSHDAIIKAKNLLRSQLHNGYRTNQITNDAIVGGNTLTSSTNIKRSHKRSEMEKLYAKQTRCNLNGLNAATAAVVATTPASSQIINQSNDNPMPTASDISTPLWHPLFGSNSKSEYYSPWQWTTVTATGE